MGCKLLAHSVIFERSSRQISATVKQAVNIDTVYDTRLMM